MEMERKGKEKKEKGQEGHTCIYNSINGMIPPEPPSTQYQTFELTPIQGNRNISM
jgi:hypothetical protein